MSFSGALQIDFFGAELILLAERAVWWPEESMLLIADTHLGKEATFRKAGIPVPDVLEADLSRLTRLVQRTGCKRLMILGDFFHTRRGRVGSVEQSFSEWRTRHQKLEIQLVRGNHDLHAGDPPDSWGIQLRSDPCLDLKLKMAHQPEFEQTQPALAGHLHPKVSLGGLSGGFSLPCFWWRGTTLVLPAFGQFIDHQLIRRVRGDQIFVIAEDEVIGIRAKST